MPIDSCGLQDVMNGYWLATQKLANEFDSRPFSCQLTNDLGQVVHTRASVIKQYNLEPIARERCPAAWKVTVGLALH